MSDERVFRNHPSVILKNVVSTIVFIGFLILINMGSVEEGDQGDIGLIVYILAAIAAMVALLSFYFWKKTTYTFTSDELVIRVDTAFKKEDHIQYSKLASVNV